MMSTDSMFTVLDMGQISGHGQFSLLFLFTSEFTNIPSHKHALEATFLGGAEGFSFPVNFECYALAHNLRSP